MTGKNKNLRPVIKKIAYSRMIYLFQRANEIFIKNKELANKHIHLARLYAQRAKIRIPLKWKHRLCNKCKRFLYPGINYRIRLHSHRGKGSHISLTCFECNHTTRYFIKT